VSPKMAFYFISSPTAPYTMVADNVIDKAIISIYFNPFMAS